MSRARCQVLMTQQHLSAGWLEVARAIVKCSLCSKLWVQAELRLPGQERARERERYSHLRSLIRLDEMGHCHLASLLTWRHPELPNLMQRFLSGDSSATGTGAVLSKCLGEFLQLFFGWLVLFGHLDVILRNGHLASLFPRASEFGQGCLHPSSHSERDGLKSIAANGISARGLAKEQEGRTPLDDLQTESMRLQQSRKPRDFHDCEETRLA